MEKKYTLRQRIILDTPRFFKRTQLFGLSLAALGGSLSQVGGFPQQPVTILISAGTAIAAIAQFAVKQYDPYGKKDAAE